MATEVKFDAPLDQEFKGTDLGDSRRSGRLAQIAMRIGRDPVLSFPEAFVNAAELEGAYRFFRNPEVTPTGILQVHRERTWARAEGATWLLAIQDTSEARFGGSSVRTGLGPLMNGGHGFLFHPALLVSLDQGAERGIPLGVIAHEVLVSSEKEPNRPWREQYNDPEKDALRWHRVMAAADAEAAAHRRSIIHVMDREASKYDLLAECCARGGRFVIRLKRGFTDRGVASPAGSAELDRDVALSAKPAGRGKRRAGTLVRESRVAHLRVRAQSVTIPRPKHVKNVEPLPTLHLVEVTEPEPPEDTPPVHWTLITTEAVETEADLARVVDSYRARWLIEEFFKALKTGCDFEARQLESLAALHNALAVFIPIAWHMLLMRGIARDAPDTPAERVVPRAVLEILVAIARGRNEWGIRLGPTPTAKEVYWAIARVGGHLPNNGPPGWLTLRRGMDRLHHILGAAAALRWTPGRCDQS
jgi:hypothetical protein